MARTKCTTRRASPPCKRAKSAGGVKFSSPSYFPPAFPSSVRPSVGLLPPTRQLGCGYRYSSAFCFKLLFLLNPSLPDDTDPPPPFPPLGHLYFTASSKWSFYPLPDPGPDRGAGPRANQGGSTGARAAGSPPPTQQPPLGYGLAGARTEEGLGREGYHGPSRPCCSSGEGGPAARLLPGQAPEMPPYWCCCPIGLCSVFSGS
ncbi:hypothetical protein LIER_26753 [Lithospermum erythrorhizon]|uniref:Uncharacterized protein n=1 Tax=Lithospermum erythrorhizon TaxID=34254 RepID=A0AAV3RCJ2_LITER